MGFHPNILGVSIDCTKMVLITFKPNTVVEPTTTPKKIPNYHKFNLKAFPPTVQSSGGTVSLGNANNFGNPLRALPAIFYLKPKGRTSSRIFIQPQAELDYVISGRARMTIFSPGG